jgi:dephospho-CoA kinase
LYKSSADVIIDASGTVEDVVNQILKVIQWKFLL